MVASPPSEAYQRAEGERPRPGRGYTSLPKAGEFSDPVTEGGWILPRATEGGE